MKLLRRSIERGGPGFVKLQCDDADDMWHVFNLIRHGDSVKASTFRKVVNESSTGTTSSQRLQITLKIVVESVEYDGEVSTLHVKGRNVQESAYVKMGAYHTLDLEQDRPFSLEKPVWDQIDLERLDEAVNPEKSADLAAVVMHEGLAHVCLITRALTIVKAKIDMQIAKKRKGFAGQHDKTVAKFLQNVAQAFLKHINLQVVKCVLVASRGFLRDQFMEVLVQVAEAQGIKLTAEQRAKFVLQNASSGFKHSLKEVLQDPAVAARLADTKAQAEVTALNTFYDYIAHQPDRAYYGLKEVLRANREQAIETLLLSDSLFRSNDVPTRRQYIGLVESVRRQGGRVLIFSSVHVSGEQLDQLTGCAAILRFPLPELPDGGDETEG